MEKKSRAKRSSASLKSKYPELERTNLAQKIASKESEFCIHELAFDQYQRYKIVQEITDLVRSEEKLKILDVGGYPGVITRFLPNDNISLLDTVQAKIPNYTQGNVLSLPFGKDSFDLVTCIDVLEHIAPEDRERAVKELLRVSNDLVIIAAPVNSGQNRLSEEILASFTFEVLKQKNKFLAEHLKNALPDLSELKDLLAKNDLKCVTIPNAYLYNWLAMNLLNAYIVSLPGSSNLYHKVNRFYNLNFYKHDNREPSYRQIVVATKKTTDISFLKDRFIAETTRLDEIHLLQLMQLFLSGVNIRGEIESIFEEKRRHIKTLGRHVKNLETLAKEKGKHAENLEVMVKEREKHVRNLEAEIGEKGKHAENLEVMVKEREKHVKNLEAEIAEKEKHTKNLETSLKEKDKHINSLQTEIGEKESAAKKLNAESEEKSKQITELKLLRQTLEEKADDLALELKKFQQSRLFGSLYRKKGR